MSTIVTQCAENTIAIEQLQDTNSQLLARVDQVESRYNKLNDVLIYQEMERRRINLLIHGLDELAWETREHKEKIAKDFLEDMFHPDNVPSFQTASRLGARGQRHANRPILIVFQSLEDRHRVWKAKHNINKRSRDSQDTGTADNTQDADPDDMQEVTQIEYNRARSNAVNNRVFLTQDYPEEIRARRRRLVPIFKVAKGLAEFRDNTYLHDDKLIIKDTTYNVNNMYTLGGPLNPMRISTHKEGETLFFWSANSPLSNHHPSVFVIADKTYGCVEQFYMYQKALKANDMVRAQAILDTDDPGMQKQIAKSVRPNNWNQLGPDVMITGIRAKFKQNKMLNEFLKNTKDLTLAEASPYDTFYGIGLGLDSMEKTDPANWRGQNKLGDMLNIVREEISTY